MIDLDLVRRAKQGDRRVRDSQTRRAADPTVVDRIIQLHDIWRDAQYALERCRADLNASTVRVAAAQKSAEADLGDMIQGCKSLKEQLPTLELAAREAAVARDEVLATVGNLVAEDAPTGSDEAQNVEVRRWGNTPRISRSHRQLLQLLGFADLRGGALVAGSRGYFLKGDGVLLNMALLQCAMSHAVQRGFDPVAPPFMMRRSAMARCAQLSDFDDTLYKVEPDSYLIATSEQPLCAMHEKVRLHEGSLPHRYAGVSTCFRREAGSHGQDTLGLFRVHQFEKVEQFVVCHADRSAELMNELMRNCEDFYRGLELPFRVVDIVAGALNNSASRKYDLEGWFPASGAYRELVSCSNCTDYQSRQLDCRIGQARVHPHMLNATLVASQRTLCCLLENHQTDTGVVVPPALRPFMAVPKTFLPFNSQE